MDIMIYIILAVVIVSLSQRDFDYTPVFSTTVDLWAENKAVDNVSARSPMLNWMRAKGRIKSYTLSGGHIVEPVLSTYDKSRVQALAAYQEIDLSPESGQITMLYTKKDVTNTMMISKTEWDSNQGEQQMINLADSKTEQSSLELADQFEEWLYGDGTDQDGKVPLGLGALISLDNTGTLCGYDRATNAWLQNVIVDGTKDADDWDRLRWAFSRCYRRCARGTIKTELILTSEEVFEAYETLYYDKVMLTSEEYQDLGFDNYRFKKAALSWSEHITTNFAYFLNSYALRLRSGKTGSTIFTTGPMVNLEDTLKMKARGKLTSWEGAFTVNAFRTLGVVYPIT